MTTIEDDYSFIDIDIISLGDEELTFAELMKKAHKPLQLYQENQYSKRKLKLMANKWIDEMLKGEFLNDYEMNMKLQEAKLEIDRMENAKKQWYPIKDL